MFKVQYQYFDSKVDQHTKILERATIKDLISAMNEHLLKVELYQISHVSYNLINYDLKACIKKILYICGIIIPIKVLSFKMVK